MNYCYTDPGSIHKLRDVKPIVQGHTITLRHSPKWNPPCVITTPVIYDPEFMAIHCQCVLAERDIRQGWYFYHQKGDEVLRLTWSKLPKCLQEIILDLKPCYAANPGKG